MVPLDKQSPNQFGPHGQMVLKISVPMDKWSPTNLVPLDKWSLEYSICPGGQAVGILKYGDQVGRGPFVQGDQILGDHLSRGTKFDGDRLSRGIGSPGIKWVREQMRRSLNFANLNLKCQVGEKCNMMLLISTNLQHVKFEKLRPHE